MRVIVLMVCAGVSAFALASCNSPPGAGPAASSSSSLLTTQPGDRRLSCDDLETQMSQMDNVIQSQTTTSSLTSSGSSAVSSALSSSTSAIGSFLSGIVPVASDAASQQQQKTVDQAQARKDHLQDLYDQKNCGDSDSDSDTDTGGSSSSGKKKRQ